jgi:hypothetical protein
MHTNAQEFLFLNLAMLHGRQSADAPSFQQQNHGLFQHGYVDHLLTCLSNTVTSSDDPSSERTPSLR